MIEQMSELALLGVVAAAAFLVGRAYERQRRRQRQHERERQRARRERERLLFEQSMHAGEGEEWKFPDSH